VAVSAAMKQNDISSLRRAIETLAPSKQLRRYSPALRARLVALVRAHPDRGITSLARALGMAPQTLDRITSGARAPLVPVKLIENKTSRSALLVRGPRGIVVEGLDVNGVADLIRALS
jgi:transposase-like protein